MIQIVVIVEEDSNPSFIRNAIKMIKGVKKTFIHRQAHDISQEILTTRLQAFDELAGSVSPNNIDIDDDRTNYLLNK